MGLLQQASCAVADTYQLTMSFWCKILETQLADSGGFRWSPIMTLGTGGDSSCGTVWFNCDPDFSFPYVVVQLIGQSNSINGDSCTKGDRTNGTLVNYLDFPEPPLREATVHQNPLDVFNYDSGNVYTPGMGVRIPVPGIGQWFHVLFSVDLNSDCVVDEDGLATSYQRLFAYCNAVDRSPVDILPGSPGTYPPGSFFSGAFFSDGTSAHSITPHSMAPAGSWGHLEPGPIVVTDGTFDSIQAFMPKWKIAFNGQPVGFPAFSGAKYIDFNPDPVWPDLSVQRTDLANVQIWTDLFLSDLATAYPNFVKIAGGRGTPQPMSMANELYGPPVFAFSGGKAAFPINQGTGGGFSVVGTLSDTMAPSF